jgi:uncharacterized protein involved in response to NO
MEFFLPSLLLMLIAFLVSVYIVPTFTPAVIAVVAIILLILGVYNHYVTFSSEYNVMQWADTGRQIAPTLITGLVIVLMGGYIIYMFSSKGGMPSLPSFSAASPPPNTATNPLTQGIGNALNAAGATTINRNYVPENNMNTARMRNAESQLARAT